MSKPRKYGTQRAYTPNSRADSRRPKLWEYNRRIAERDALAIRQEKERKQREQWKERFYAQRES